MEGRGEREGELLPLAVVVSQSSPKVKKLPAFSQLKTPIFRQ